MVLKLEKVPLLAGAQECAAAGIRSSLHPSNERAAAAVSNADVAVKEEAWPLLVDPQTGGAWCYLGVDGGLEVVLNGRQVSEEIMKMFNILTLGEQCD